jgi:hypothetical protein
MVGATMTMYAKRMDWRDIMKRAGEILAGCLRCMREVRFDRMQEYAEGEKQRERGEKDRCE